MNAVAIIGVGLYPFGRFEGKTAMQMGVDAIHAAPADTGVAWNDIQFGVGGSWTVANPDAIVSLVGLTRISYPSASESSVGGCLIPTACRSCARNWSASSLATM
jgi:acetyl-CoA C-acetyltransferase